MDWRKAFWIMAVGSPFLVLAATDNLPKPGLPPEENWRRTKDLIIVLLANIGLGAIIAGQAPTKGVVTAKAAKIRALVPP